MAAINEEFPHIISSTSDSDMNLIEDIVNAYKYKENKAYQYTLFSYYISRVYSYFLKAEKYIKGEKIKKDFEKIMNIGESFNIRMKVLDKFRTDFEPNRLRFDELIEYTKNNFEKTNVCNPIDFNTIFYFIGSIFCLDLENDLSLDMYYASISKENRHRLYPLPNGTGLFSINSYMYALFEGVYLLGIPTKAAYFDGIFDCVGKFFLHDIVHSDNEIMIEKKMIIEEYKKLYIAIINDSEFSQEEKELHILVMWYLIHERANPYEDPSVYDISVYISGEGIQSLPFGIEEAVITDFLKDFKRFSSFTVNDDIIRIMTVGLNNYKNENYTYKLVYERVTDPNSSFYPSYICSACFIYSIEIISTKFNDLIKEIIQSR